MDAGFVLDSTFQLSFPEQCDVVRQAARLGYSSAWAPGGVTSRDAFHTCVQWSAAGGPGFTTGTSVVVAPHWTPVTLAVQAATTAELVSGPFILGIGSGAVHLDSTRTAFDLPDRPVISLMRDYLTILRGLLDGEWVDYQGRTTSLRGVQLGFRPPRVPLYVGGLGPQMLSLAGELADGIIPSWSSPERVAWSREHAAAAARRAGRDPSTLKWVGFVRVCIDEDADAARRTFAASLLRYGLARPGGSRTEGYRGQFGRMGFDDVLTKLEERRDNGASMDELIDALPVDLMRRVGYFGRPEGVAADFARLAVGLDTAVVRMITTSPGPAKVMLALEACRDVVLAGAPQLE
jgi:alkanesulfonate monooxygenase SsuD/methylene tetrahydromethanopterin reductase-like flavin-dependent oxidoreductase (luciferase family)